MRSTINAGVSTRDFFGVAYGHEGGRYQGFHFGETTTAIFDDALLLVEPKVAADFASKLAQEQAERETEAKGKQVPVDSAGQGAGQKQGQGEAKPGQPPQNLPQAVKKTVFFGQVELDPIKAKLQFSDVAEEVLLLFTQKPGVKVKVSLEIQPGSTSPRSALPARTATSLSLRITVSTIEQPTCNAI